MTWIKLEDSFPDHPKIAALSDRAFRVHISALCYCGKYLTNGVIPAPIANKICVNNGSRIIKRLVEIGLWSRVEGGYEINDYLKYQTSKEQAEMEKETNRLRAAKAREARSSSMRNGVSSVVLRSTEAHTPTPTPTDIKNSSSDLTIRHKEAFALCEMLAALIEKNGSKKPTITKKWIQEMNRMIEIDKRDLREIKYLITWSQSDPFWMSNILSPSSLRAKFDQMRLKSPLSGLPHSNPLLKVKGTPSQSSNHFEAPAPGQYGVKICQRCEIEWPCPEMKKRGVK